MTIIKVDQYWDAPVESDRVEGCLRESVDSVCAGCLTWLALPRLRLMLEETARRCHRGEQDQLAAGWARSELEEF